MNLLGESADVSGMVFGSYTTHRSSGIVQHVIPLPVSATRYKGVPFPYGGAYPHSGYISPLACRAHIRPYGLLLVSARHDRSRAPSFRLPFGTTKLSTALMVSTVRSTTLPFESQTIDGLNKGPPFWRPTTSTSARLVSFGAGELPPPGSAGVSDIDPS